MRIVIAVCALLLVPFALGADTVTVTLQEGGKITSYFDQYWVVNVDGNITINNPTDRDLFSVELRYDLGPLVLIETSDTTYFQNGQFLVARIPANSSVEASYNIVGIGLADPTLLDKGVLYSSMTQLSPVIYSDSFGSLMKANLENESHTGRPGRLITVNLRNPTSFEYTILSLRVFKTPDIDPNQILDEWWIINSTDGYVVSPDNIYVHDFIDPDSAEGEVYWLQTNVYISRVTFVDDSNITRYSEVNLSIPPELLNYTINTTNASNRSFGGFTEVYVKKLADKQIVTTSEPVQISFIINNLAQKLYDYTLTDELPPGFSFVQGDGWAEQDGKLIYIAQLSAKAAAVPSYTAALVDADAAGLDFFPAGRVDYTEKGKATKTAYSDTVPFIRQYLPNKKIYVQKRIVNEGEDSVSVTISVQNLGPVPVTNLLLKEYLADSDVFSAITQAPSEKGMWEIPEIKSGELWEVTYTTTQDTNVNILPGLFGVPASDVLKSLVLENIISNAWEAVKTATIEIAGIGLLLGLPFLWFFLRKKPANLSP